VKHHIQKQGYGYNTDVLRSDIADGESKGKALLVQAWISPERSARLRLSGFSDSR
jgi:hypothetical protein